MSEAKIVGHNVFTFDDHVTFSSNFDNGNLGRVERAGNSSSNFRIWTALDNMGTEYQSKHGAWFHFMVTGLPMGCVLRIQVMNASPHGGLYKHDMRPVYRSNGTNQKWARIRSSVRFTKEAESAHVVFEHSVDIKDDKLYFAFTYPYSYTMMQNELAVIDKEYQNANDIDYLNSIVESKDSIKEAIYYHRELVTKSRDDRRIDLLTISSHEGMVPTEREPLFDSLFPEHVAIPTSSTSTAPAPYCTMPTSVSRPPVFPHKEVIFISSRVHPGEVPAQHTFKGILNILMDKTDLRAKELRRRYVFKLIPMLNPDGVYRGHFRMDQLGQNLNRYYKNPDKTLQPAIFAAKMNMDYYAKVEKLAVYLDFHAHTSRRGCFIYGNVLDSAEDQIQNQLFCRLIALHTPHFDYEGCLFSKEHMNRIDNCDAAKGLTAEGSGRVNTYLDYGLIHSYTIECNYNTSKSGNEVPPMDNDPCGQHPELAAQPFTNSPEKYTPATYHGVGRACVLAILDLRGHNPCSRIPKSKIKTFERIRNCVMMEVRGRKEYLGKHVHRLHKRSEERKPCGRDLHLPEQIVWRRTIHPNPEQPTTAQNGSRSNSPRSISAPGSARMSGNPSDPRNNAVPIASNGSDPRNDRSSSNGNAAYPMPPTDRSGGRGYPLYTNGLPAAPQLGTGVSSSRRQWSGRDQRTYNMHDPPPHASASPRTSRPQQHQEIRTKKEKDSHSGLPMKIRVDRQSRRDSSTGSAKASNNRVVVGKPPLPTAAAGAVAIENGHLLSIMSINNSNITLPRNSSTDRIRDKGGGNNSNSDTNSRVTLNGNGTGTGDNVLYSMMSTNTNTTNAVRPASPNFTGLFAGIQRDQDTDSNGAQAGARSPTDGAPGQGDWKNKAIHQVGSTRGIVSAAGRDSLFDHVNKSGPNAVSTATNSGTGHGDNTTDSHVRASTSSSSASLSSLHKRDGGSSSQLAGSPRARSRAESAPSAVSTSPINPTSSHKGNPSGSPHSGNEARSSSLSSSSYNRRGVIPPLPNSRENPSQAISKRNHQQKLLLPTTSPTSSSHEVERSNSVGSSSRNRPFVDLKPSGVKTRKASSGGDSSGNNRSGSNSDNGDDGRGRGRSSSGGSGGGSSGSSMIPVKRSSSLNRRLSAAGANLVAAASAAASTAADNALPLS